MPVCTRIWRIEVERIETERESCEERVIAFVQGPSPMMRKDLADLEIVVQITLGNFACARPPFATHCLELPLDPAWLSGKLCQSNPLARKRSVQMVQLEACDVSHHTGLAGLRRRASRGNGG